jgi:Uma2 family endonuclease
MSAVTLLTAEEYLNMPNEPGKHELLDGELISVPPAKHVHSKIAHALYELLRNVLGISRVWITEGYQLKRGWLIPDVSATWPEQPVSSWFQGAPMIAIEIVSRGNTAEDIDRKSEAYLEEGAAEVWVIYPQRRKMNVLRKDSTLRVTGEYQCGLIGVTVKLDELIASTE